MDYNYSTSNEPSGAQIALTVLLLIIIIASHWRVFTKAKQPGWASLIPIYNTYIVLKIIGKPWWWLIMLIIPVVNIFFVISLSHNLAKSFGKGVGYTVLLLILPFIGYPMLAFGDATYKGPAAK